MAQTIEEQAAQAEEQEAETGRYPDPRNHPDYAEGDEGATALQERFDNATPENREIADGRDEVFRWAEKHPDITSEEKVQMRMHARPIGEPDFWTSVNASFGSMNSVAQATDLWEEKRTRKFGANGIPEAELLNDVPKQYHEEILATAEEFNDDAAATVRDNILEDVQNNAIFDSMPWYAQLGHGGAAVIIDPLTLLPAGKIAQGANAASKMARAWQVAPAIKNVGVMSAWAAAGMTEAAIQAAPRLAADYTYTSKDYILDTVVGGLFGGGVSATIMGGKGLLKLKRDYVNQINASNDKTVTGLTTKVEERMASRAEKLDATPETDNVSTLSDGVKAEAKAATEVIDGGAVLKPVEPELDADGVAKVVEEEVVHVNAAHEQEKATENAIRAFTLSQDDINLQVGRTSKNWGVAAIRAIPGFRSMFDHFAGGDSPAARFVAANVLESPLGFAGQATRKAGAAVIREQKYLQAKAEMVPAYVQNMEAYAVEHGKGMVGKVRAMNEAGVDNPLVNKFNREFITLQELRRRGESTDSTSQAVLDFADGWNKSMDVSFNNMTGARVAGFQKSRKIAHYYPQAWRADNLAKLVKKHGDDKIMQVLAQGYRTAKGADDMTVKQSEHLAIRQMVHIAGKKTTSELNDDFVSTAKQDARSKERLNINTIAEVDGISVMDLLDTDVVTVGDKYHNRAAGWSALSESTGGLLNSDLAIKSLREKLQKTPTDDKLVRWYDDTMEMILGKPVRSGLAAELREFKDLASMTQLGGLGMAQVAETGQVVTRGVLNVFSDRTTLKQMLKDAGSTGTVDDLVTEAQQLSGMTDDFEWFNRQATHTDTTEDMSRLRQFTGKLASKATAGSRVKATASRGLGKISGFNMVRRAQNRVAHATLMRDLHAHFTTGKSSAGVARLKDLGVLDNNGLNPLMRRTFMRVADIAEDGRLVRLNIEKWPKKQRDELAYALTRDTAQTVQRTLVGELPPWMNSPLMSLLMQYREMPLVAMNKSLGRAVGFADREVVVGVMLSAMTAGIAMAGRQFVVAGEDSTHGEEFRDVNLKTVDVAKYVNFAGMFPDMYDLVQNGYGAYQQDDRKAVGELLMRQVPTLSLLKGYYGTGKAVKDADMQEFIESGQLLTPLGNTMLGDAMFSHMIERL